MISIKTIGSATVLRDAPIPFTNWTFKVYSLQGTFNQRFDFRSFFFDSHKLDITLGCFIEFARCLPFAIRSDLMDSSLPPGWSLNSVKYGVTTKSIHNLGGLNFEYFQIQSSVIVKRDPFSWITMYLLPLNVAMAFLFFSVSYTGLNK